MSHKIIISYRLGNRILNNWLNEADNIVKLFKLIITKVIVIVLENIIYNLMF